ncbi:hypothetical protein BHM03_00010921 [Ensete ventricosum]|nr:hypothetical protein BHM03_00010921 [Ensete ventricosum]
MPLSLQVRLIFPVDDDWGYICWGVDQRASYWDATTCKSWGIYGAMTCIIPARAWTWWVRPRKASGFLVGGNIRSQWCALRGSHSGTHLGSVEDPCTKVSSGWDARHGLSDNQFNPLTEMVLDVWFVERVLKRERAEFRKSPIFIVLGMTFIPDCQRSSILDVSNVAGVQSQCHTPSCGPRVLAEPHLVLDDVSRGVHAIAVAGRPYLRHIDHTNVRLIEPPECRPRLWRWDGRIDLHDEEDASSPKSFCGFYIESLDDDDDDESEEEKAEEGGNLGLDDDDDDDEEEAKEGGTCGREDSISS